MADYTWLIGVVLASVASLISNLGLNVQKLNHLRNEEKQEREQLEQAKRQLKKRKRAMRRREQRVKEQQQRVEMERAVAAEQTANANAEDEERLRKTLNNELVEEDDDGGSQADVERDDDAGSSVDDSDQRVLVNKTANVVVINGGVGAINGDDDDDDGDVDDDDDDDDDVSEDELLREAALARSRRPSLIPGSGDDEDVIMRPFMTPDPVDSRPAVNYCSQKLWLGGLSLVIIGSVCDFAALAFAAQSVVAPLGSLTLVSNLWLAQLLLGEKISRQEIVATLGIVTGSALAVAFASHEDVDYQIDELFALYAKLRFFIYAFLVLLTLLVMRVMVHYIESIYDDCLHGALPRHSYNKWAGYHRFLYPAMAGTVGAQSVLFAKTTAELLKLAFQGQGNIFVYWQTYLVLAGMGLTINFQIRWLNAGLLRFDALYTVPVFQTFWILVSVAGGLVFFNEYEQVFENRATVIDTIGFPFGVTLTIVGVYYLSLRSSSGDHLANPDNLPMLRLQTPARGDGMDVALLAEDGLQPHNDYGASNPRTPISMHEREHLKSAHAYYGRQRRVSSSTVSSNWASVSVASPVGESLINPSYDPRKLEL